MIRFFVDLDFACGPVYAKDVAAVASRDFVLHLTPID